MCSSSEGSDNSPLASPSTVLEEDCLIKEQIFGEIFQSIYNKYDRVYLEEERGGRVVDFRDPGLLEEAVQNHIFPKNRKSSTILSIKDFQVDPLRVTELHKKVVKVKKDTNWNEEEELHHQQRVSSKELSSSEEDEDRTAECKKVARRKRKRSVESNPKLQHYCQSTSSSCDERRALDGVPPEEHEECKRIGRKRKFFEETGTDGDVYNLESSYYDEEGLMDDTLVLESSYYDD